MRPRRTAKYESRRIVARIAVCVTNAHPRVFPPAPGEIMTTTLSASVVEPDPILNTGDLPARGKLPKTRLHGRCTTASRMRDYRERTSRPHLSLSVPHCTQVLPPHRACLSDCGLRSCGMGTLQDGHDVELRLTPQRFLVTVPTATSTAPVKSRPKTTARTTMAAYLRRNRAVA